MSCAIVKITMRGFQQHGTSLHYPRNPLKVLKAGLSTQSDTFISVGSQWVQVDLHNYYCIC